MPPPVYRAREIEPRGIDWLWREHIPYGMVVTVAGRPGLGKSMFCTAACADLSQEGEHVLYSTVEDPLHEVVRPRLEAAGANLDNVHLWKDGMTIPKDIYVLGEYIEQHGIVMCVLDSIAAQLGVSISADQPAKRALRPLTALAEETDCAMVLLHHTRKSITSSMSALDAIGGSGGGLNAVSRAAYILGRSPTDANERVLAQAKCNIAKTRPSLAFDIDSEQYVVDNKTYETGFLVHTGETDVNADSILRLKDTDVPLDSPQQEQREARAAEWLITYLSRGPRRTNATVAAGRAAGLTGLRVREVAEKLELVEERGLWRLPEGLMEFVSG